MIQIKLSFPFPDSPLEHQSPGNSCIWEDVQFSINPPENDSRTYHAWIVFDKITGVAEKSTCPKKNTVFITAEPRSLRKYSNLFLKQFGQVITSHTSIRHPHKTYALQCHPWFVGKSYDELIATTAIEKKKNISIITSNKLFSDGHKKRYEYCMQLKEYFGDAIDLFGRGVNSFDDKWDTLAPYKYSIAIENAVYDHWITEKLFDCFLAHCYPLYYGSPLAGSYFSPEAFTTIDINNLDQSKKQVENILNNPGLFNQKLPYLIKAKMQYLQTYNIFPFLANFCKSKMDLHAKPEPLKIKTESTLFYKATRRLFD